MDLQTVVAMAAQTVASMGEKKDEYSGDSLAALKAVKLVPM